MGCARIGCRYLQDTYPIRNIDLHMLWGILKHIGVASGLFTNLENCVATPIHFSDSLIQFLKKISLIHQSASCKVTMFFLNCGYAIPAWNGKAIFVLNLAGRATLPVLGLD